MDYKKAKLLYRISFAVSLLSLAPLFIYNRLIIGCMVLLLVSFALGQAVGFIYLKCPHCGRNLVSARKVNYCPDCGKEVEK